MRVILNVTSMAALAIGVAGCTSDGGGPTGATETNVVPAPCDTNEDCPPDVVCVHFHDDETGEEGPGFCDVQEMEGTTGTAPAPCTVDSDCGADRPCLHRHDDATGDELGGFCKLDSTDCPHFCQTGTDVEQTICASDANCAAGTSCGPVATCAF